MSFFSFLKKIFGRTKRKKNQGIEMLDNVKPVYNKKIVGVSSKRNHVVKMSPPLRQHTIRRGQMTPIQSMSSSSSRPSSGSRSSRSRRFVSIGSTRSTGSTRSKGSTRYGSTRSTGSTRYGSTRSRRSRKSSNSNNTRRKKQRGKQPTSDKRKIYRSRIKTSQCRGIRPGSKCKESRPCKYAMGNIRQFCRKRKNTRASS